MVEHEDLPVVLDHDLVTEVLEDTNRQNLCEDVSKVLGGLDVEWFDDVLFAQHTDPYYCRQSMCFFRLLLKQELLAKSIAAALSVPSSIGVGITCPSPRQCRTCT